MSQVTHAVPAVERSRRLAARIRAVALEMIVDAGYGFAGSCMSVADLLAAFYTRWPVAGGAGPDRVCLSKGHAAPALYAAEFGDSWRETGRYAAPDSPLQGHPRADLLAAVTATAGPLGLAVGHALGRQLAAVTAGHRGRLAVLVGDGELQTGPTLEALTWLAESALPGVAAVVDVNGWQSTGTTPGRAIAGLRAMFDEVHEVDGNDHVAIDEVVDAITPDTAPALVVARTRRWAGTPWADRPPSSMRELPGPDELRRWIDVLTKEGTV